MAEIGARLRFKGVTTPDGLTHLGHDDGTPIGENSVRMPLEKGSVGTVVARVPAHVDGAGTHDADCTVLAFGKDEATLDANGDPIKVARYRNISFEDDQLVEWFEAAVEASE